MGLLKEIRKQTSKLGSGGSVSSLSLSKVKKEASGTSCASSRTKKCSNVFGNAGSLETLSTTSNVSEATQPVTPVSASEVSVSDTISNSEDADADGSCSLSGASVAVVAGPGGPQYASAHACDKSAADTYTTTSTATGTEATPSTTTETKASSAILTANMMPSPARSRPPRPPSSPLHPARLNPRHVLPKAPPSLSKTKSTPSGSAATKDAYVLKREQSIGNGTAPASISTRSIVSTGNGAASGSPSSARGRATPTTKVAEASEGKFFLDHEEHGDSDALSDTTGGGVALSTDPGATVPSMVTEASRQSRDSARFLQDGHDAASDYVRLGEYDKALAIFEDILRHHRRVYGDESHRVGSALHNIGIVLIRAADYGRALPVCRKAVRVRRAALGPDHPAVAVSMVECGIVYLALEKYERALYYFRDALAIRRRSLGPDHPHVARTLNNIGCVHFEVGEMDDALCAFDEALYVQRLVLANDPNADAGLMTVAATLCNVGYIYLKRNEWDEAAEVLSEALLIQESVLGENHKTVIATKENLATANARSEYYDTALALYQSVLNFYRNKHETVAHPTCAAVIHKMCHIYISTGRLDEAKADLESLLSYQEYLYAKEDKETVKTRDMMQELSVIMRRPVLGEFKPSKIINPFDVQCHQFWLLGPLEDLQDLQQHVRGIRPEMMECARGIRYHDRLENGRLKRYDIDRDITMTRTEGSYSGDEDDLSFTSMFSHSDDEMEEDFLLDRVRSMASAASDFTGANCNTTPRSLRC